MPHPDLDALFDLINTPGPSGFEQPNQQRWIDYVTPHADAVATDAYGSAWATLEGTDPDAPTLMLDAHSDEIGYMIHHITDEGFLHVLAVGRSDPGVARGQRVRIFGDDGPVMGVIGQTAIHLRDREDDTAPEVHELFVDVGVESRDAVHGIGLRVGHPLLFPVKVQQMQEHRITGRAIDNRVGSYIVAQVLEALSEDRPACTVYIANTVLEEQGGKGADMLAHRLHPDVAVCFDVAHANDTPGLDKRKHGGKQLGKGPIVSHGGSNHPRVARRLLDVAKDADIPMQHRASGRRSGTNTDHIFRTRSGIPSALVSIPLRYMHSPVETADLRDVERCIRLLTAFAHSITANDSFFTFGAS